MTEKQFQPPGDAEEKMRKFTERMRQYHEEERLHPADTMYCCLQTAVFIAVENNVPLTMLQNDMKLCYEATKAEYDEEEK